MDATGLELTGIGVLGVVTISCDTSVVVVAAVIISSSLSSKAAVSHLAPQKTCNLMS